MRPFAAVVRAQRQVSFERVASFGKRLCVLATQLPPFLALGALHLVRECLDKYPKVTQILEKETVAR